MNKFRFAAFAIFAAALMPHVADAKSFSSLAKDGYKASKLTRSKGGSLGWMLQKDGSKYFCKMEVGVAYKGKHGMVAFTSSGRLLSMDRKAYEDTIGGPDSSLPQLSDLEAGRLKPSHVGKCIPQR